MTILPNADVFSPIETCQTMRTLTAIFLSMALVFMWLAYTHIWYVYKIVSVFMNIDKILSSESLNRSSCRRIGRIIEIFYGQPAWMIRNLWGLNRQEVFQRQAVSMNYEDKFWRIYVDLRDRINVNTALMPMLLLWKSARL